MMEEIFRISGAIAVGDNVDEERSIVTFVLDLSCVSMTSGFDRSSYMPPKELYVLRPEQSSHFVTIIFSGAEGDFDRVCSWAGVCLQPMALSDVLALLCTNKEVHSEDSTCNSVLGTLFHTLAVGFETKHLAISGWMRDLFRRMNHDRSEIYCSPILQYQAIDVSGPWNPQKEIDRWKILLCTLKLALGTANKHLSYYYSDSISTKRQPHDGANADRNRTDYGIIYTNISPRKEFTR